MGGAFPANLHLGGYGSTEFYWRLANMTIPVSQHLRMMKVRSLSTDRCSLRISEIGSNVIVNVHWKDTPGVVCVSLPLASTVCEHKGRTTTWFFLGSPDALKDAPDVHGVETVSVTHVRT